MIEIEKNLRSSLERVIEEYEKFVRDYGGLENNEILSLPEITRNRAVKQAKMIEKLANKVDRYKRRLITHVDVPVFQSHEKHLEFYDVNIAPVINELNKLINPELWQLFEGFDFGRIPESAVIPSKYTKKSCLNDLLFDVLSCLEDEESMLSIEWEGRDDEIEEIIEITTSLYFEPDLWLSNLSDIKPLELSKSTRDLPEHVRERLREVFRCYVYGNWFSCISTSRSLMEYSVIDMGATKLGINVYKDNETRKVKKLSHIIDEIDDSEKCLKDNMNYVKEYGNDAMHPIKARKAKSIVFGKPQALHCLMALVAVLTELYSKNSPNE